MRKLPRVSTVILLFPFLLFNVELYAQTEVGDIQSGTWSLGKSPYIVTSEIVIPQGLVLKIQPGVVIKFAGNYRIAVSGGLIAQGDKKRPVVFTSIFDTTSGKIIVSNKKIPGAGDWKGIEFLDECDDYTTVMDHCIIRYSNWGIHCYDVYPLLINITFAATEQRSLMINNTEYPFETGQRISPITPGTRPVIAPLPEPVQQTDLDKVKRALEQQQLKLEQIRLKALQDSIRLANKVKPVFTNSGKITLENRVFDQLNIHSMNELISYLPGFLNIATIWTGSQLTSRGVPPNLSNNRLLFKFDDTPFYEPIAKTSYLNFIPLDGIEAVEIDRGIALSRFNHHGIAGSVNIIPQHKTPGFVNKSRVELGTFGTKKLSGFLGLNRDSTLLNLSMNFMNNSGYWRTFSPGESSPGFRQKYANDLYNLSLFLKYTASDLFVSYFENDQFQLGLVPQFQYTNPIKRRGLVLSMSHTLKINPRLHGKIVTNYVDTYERSAINNFVLPGSLEPGGADYFLSKGNLFSFSILSQYKKPRYLVTAGVTFSRFFVSPLFEIKNSRGEIIQNENWTTVAKIVKYENTGFVRIGYNITPFWGIDGKTTVHFADSYREPDFSVAAKIIYNPFLPVDSYLKYSFASRSATLIERYVHFPGLVYGNTDLKSEKFAELEWCTDIHPKQDLKFGFALYHSKNTDVIELTPEYYFENDNHTYQATGCEVILQGKIFNRSFLLTNVSYDHFKSSRWRYPQFRINGLANIHWFRNFSTITAIQYLSEFETGTKFGPYYLANLFLVYQLLPRIKISLKCFDLLDQHPGNPEYIRGEMAAIPAGPGRCFFISTTIE